MARFIALWNRPDDIGGFEEHYRGAHMALVQGWPGVSSTTVTRITGSPMGAPTDPGRFIGSCGTDTQCLNPRKLRRI